MKRKLKQLKDQVLVITGASSGIGLVTARMAAREGARLVLSARSDHALRRLTEEINQHGDLAVYVVADISKPEEVRRIIQAAEDTFGGFDTWVNNAGVSMYGKMVDEPIEDMQKLFETNVWGVVYGSLQAARHLKRHGGAIINIGSTLSDRAIILQGIYSASKHAVAGFTDALRMELEADGAPVSVTLIKPGAIDTPYTHHAKNYMDVEPKHPPPVYAPETVAETILHCAETPVREVFVGAGGKGISWWGRHAPDLTDTFMEWVAGPLQRSHRAPRSREQNGLDRPSGQLRERGDHEGYVAETSLYTHASLHPMLTGAALLAVGVAAFAWLGNKSTPRQSRRRASLRDDYRYAPKPTSQPGPVPYSPRIEQIDTDEEETNATIVNLMKGINETTYKDSSHAVRSSHAKSYGLLQGRLQVLDNLPATLAQGVFAKPASYPVVMRMSAQPGDMLDDSVSCPRAIALKIIGVEGKRLRGSEEHVTQDFIMQNAPVFEAKNAKTFLNHLRMIAPTADTGNAWKKAFSSVMRGVEATVEAVGGESAVVKALGGEPMTHPLGEIYYTQVPLLYGLYMAKVAVAPLSLNIKNLTGVLLDVTGNPNGLREAVVEFFRQHDAEWEVRVQLCTDVTTMPIEDSSVRWPEDQSPYIPVGRIFVSAQDAWSEARSAAIDDGLSFSPWHGLAAHRPLGSIMRARKVAYAMSAQFRQERNQRSVQEPRRIEDVHALEPSEAASGL